MQLVSAEKGINKCQLLAVPGVVKAGCRSKWPSWELCSGTRDRNRLVKLGISIRKGQRLVTSGAQQQMALTMLALLVTSHGFCDDMPSAAPEVSWQVRTYKEHNTTTDRSLLLSPQPSSGARGSDADCTLKFAFCLLSSSLCLFCSSLSTSACTAPFPLIKSQSDNHLIM